MSHPIVIEIISIKEPSPLPKSKMKFLPPKKIIKGPHFKPIRHSIKGRMPVLRRGVR